MDCGDDVDGQAAWFCDGCSGEFVGVEPDRLQCVDKWIGDIGDQISDPETSSSVIAESILTNLQDNTGPGVTGGGIKTLVSEVGSLLNKRQSEDDREGAKEFTDNLLHSSSLLLDLEVGWNEIQDDEVRFRTSGDILRLVDEIGFMFSQERDDECEDLEDTFKHTNIELIVRTNTTKSDQCFSFSSQGTICLPITAVPEIIHCPTFISSNLLVNTTVNLFPRTITNKNLTQEADLSQDLISLTLNNGSVPVNIDEDSPEVITVTFKHESKVNN